MGILSPQFISHRRALDQNLEVAELAIKVASAIRDTDRLAVLNVSLFSNLFGRDLVCLLDGILNGPSPDHRSLTSRVLVLTLYEWQQTLPRLLGAPFRSAVRKWDPPTEWHSHFRTTMRAFSQFRRAHEASFKEVRVTAIAHREADATLQLARIRAVDADEGLGLGTWMLNWTSELYESMTTLIAHHVKIERFRFRDA